MNVLTTPAHNTWATDFQNIPSLLILNGKLWQADMPVLDNITNCCSWRCLDFQLHREEKTSKWMTMLSYASETKPAPAHKWKTTYFSTKIGPYKAFCCECFQKTTQIEDLLFSFCLQENSKRLLRLWSTQTMHLQYKDQSPVKERQWISQKHSLKAF